MKAIARGINDHGFINEIRFDEKSQTFLNIFITPDAQDADDEHTGFSVSPVMGFGGFWAAADHGGGAEPFSPKGFIQQGMTGFRATYHNYCDVPEGKTFSSIEDAVIWLVNLSNHHGYELELDHIKKL